MTSGIEKIVTYWLTPAEPARSYFASVISDLAKEFDAPVFEPHVTLYVLPAANEQPARALETVIANLKPLRLSVAGIDYSDQYTKTLFVQFRPDPAVEKLLDKLRRTSISHREYELNPHLSLIYKKIPGETKAQIAGSLGLPFDDVRFDSVKAVISPAKIESREDVEAWRVIAAESFTE
jgi:2'-5' RNA ligase